MKGFFTTKETAPKQNVQASVKSIASCGICKLCHSCKSPKMSATGDGNKKILIIAEAPGETEDVRNTQLVGKAGQTTRRIFKELGIDLDRDTRKINAINCRPTKDSSNRTPTKAEIDYCRPLVWNEIKKFKPQLIFLLGGSALSSFLSHRMKKEPGGIMKWRGNLIPDRDTQAFVMPTFHPSFLDRQTSSDVAELLFKKDIKFALEHAVPANNWRFEKKQEEDAVEIITKENEINAYLNDTNKIHEPLVFDYETTGLKPHAKGHRIVSCAFTNYPGEAVAFPVSSGIESALKTVLTNPKIPKIAQNLKFEELWSREIFGIGVANWIWDTMVATHIMDNRTGVTGLKHQAYTRFGRLDYDSHIEPYLSGDKKNANSFNKIYEIDPIDLYLYNGVDTIFEYALAEEQMHEMKSPLIKQMLYYPF